MDNMEAKRAILEKTSADALLVMLVDCTFRVDKRPERDARLEYTFDQIKFVLQIISVLEERLESGQLNEKEEYAVGLLLPQYGRRMTYFFGLWEKIVNEERSQIEALKAEMKEKWSLEWPLTDVDFEELRPFLHDERQPQELIQALQDFKEEDGDPA